MKTEWSVFWKEMISTKASHELAFYSFAGLSDPTNYPALQASHWFAPRIRCYNLWIIFFLSFFFFWECQVNVKCLAYIQWLLISAVVLSAVSQRLFIFLCMCIYAFIFIGIIRITFFPSENATVAAKEKTLRKNITTEGDHIQAGPSKPTCKDIFVAIMVTYTFTLCLSIVFACNEKALKRCSWHVGRYPLVCCLRSLKQEAFYSDLALGTQTWLKWIYESVSLKKNFSNWQTNGYLFVFLQKD